jgi:hypothetical protein
MGVRVLSCDVFVFGLKLLCLGGVVGGCVRCWGYVYFGNIVCCRIEIIIY